MSLTSDRRHATIIAIVSLLRAVGADAEETHRILAEVGRHFFNGSILPAGPSRVPPAPPASRGST